MQVFADYRQIAVTFREHPPLPDVHMIDKKVLNSQTFFQVEEVDFYNKQVFEPFLNFCFGFNLEQISPSVAYVARFFGMGLDFTEPEVRVEYTYLDAEGQEVTDTQQEPKEMIYEELLGIQTYNPYMLEWCEYFVHE